MSEINIQQKWLLILIFVPLLVNDIWKYLFWINFGITTSKLALYFKTIKNRSEILLNLFLKTYTGKILKFLLHLSMVCYFLYYNINLMQRATALHVLVETMTIVFKNLDTFKCFGIFYFHLFWLLLQMKENFF